MRTWKIFHCARGFLVVLLGIYGCLFVLLHRLDIESASKISSSSLESLSSRKNNLGTNAVIPFLNRGPSSSNKNHAPETNRETNKTITTLPAPSLWKNHLIEGNWPKLLANENLWDQTDLPLWMKEYFEWHKQKRMELELNPDSAWKNINFYIVECSEKFENCGGTADRLAPLPLHVRMAATYERLLLISWRDSRPAPLESFLLPPMGGIDWRMPAWLLKKFQLRGQKRRVATYLEKLKHWGPDATAQWLRVKVQSQDRGENEYNERRMDASEPTFAQVFHDLWRVFFTPVNTIAEQVTNELRALNLYPGRYHSIHVRALYGVDEQDENLIRHWAQNAVNCATTELPATKAPLLFVSDSKLAKDEAYDYGIKKGIPVIHRVKNHDRQPLHLEKDNGTSIEEFYDTFVDVLLIGLGRCTVYHVGGFGKWGSLISEEPSCEFRMRLTAPACDLRSNAMKMRFEERRSSTFNIPLFLPAIQNHENEAFPNVSGDNFNYSRLSFALDDKIYSDPLVFEEFNTTKYGVNLWGRSVKMPIWMKKYFKWHKKQRAHNLNPEKWQSMRLLVMECLRHHSKCGGTSDRLKTVPTLLRLAASTNRFLMIHWTRPCQLEEFLLPPKGGLDWRVPAWLHPALVDAGESITAVDDVIEFAQSSEPIIRTKYQSYDGGQGWYNEGLKGNESAFNEVFHDVWRVFFTPSPPIAKRIKKEMSQKGLVPGQYVSAHLRALYGQESRSAGQTKIWTRNALNCSTKLKPDRPIFFASDSKIASDYSIEYGQRMNGTIVTHKNNPDPPLHLDKAENFSDFSTPSLPVQVYYDTFVDLYLLALGQCVYLTKGGYGHWALLIGGNTTCVMRFKRGKGKILNPCNWTTLNSGMIQKNERSLTQALFLEPEW